MSTKRCYYNNLQIVRLGLGCDPWAMPWVMTYFYIGEFLKKAMGYGLWMQNPCEPTREIQKPMGYEGVDCTVLCLGCFFPLGSVYVTEFK